MLKGLIEKVLDSFDWRFDLLDGLRLPRLELECPLYIHVPFCSMMCPFCMFHSLPADGTMARRYFRCLRREVEEVMSMGLMPTEVYVGGGTPTLFTEEVCELLDTVRSYFKFGPTSVESSVYDMDDSKASELASAGVTRISIGLQSTRGHALRRLGRPPVSPERAADAIDAASRVGSVNVDLIIGVPGQGEDDVLEDIEVVASTRASQVTIYPLMRSAVRQAWSLGEAEEAKRDLYYFAEATANSMGFRQESVWSYSRGPYVEPEYVADSFDFIGVGLGSMSHVKGLVTVNSFDVDRYGKLVSRGLAPVVMERRLTAKEEALLCSLYMLYSLELDRNLVRLRTGLDPGRLWQVSLMRVLRLLSGRGNRLLVTERGKFVVSTIMEEFYYRVSKVRALGRALHV